jgi:hypothetical protein
MKSLNCQRFPTSVSTYRPPQSACHKTTLKTFIALSKDGTGNFLNTFLAKLDLDQADCPAQKSPEKTRHSSEEKRSASGHARMRS